MSRDSNDSGRRGRATRDNSPYSAAKALQFKENTGDESLTGPTTRRQWTQWVSTKPNKSSDRNQGSEEEEEEEEGEEEVGWIEVGLIRCLIGGC